MVLNVINKVIGHFRKASWLTVQQADRFPDEHTVRFLAILLNEIFFSISKGTSSIVIIMHISTNALK